MISSGKYVTLLREKNLNLSFGMGFEPEFGSVGPQNEALNPLLYNLLFFSLLGVRGSLRIFFEKKGKVSKSWKKIWALVENL